jgi:sugar-specific transcriptional regulator TrmB
MQVCAMLEKLRQLGWSEYEGKTYLALLRHHPATGYRAARESGVPTAKIYEALARLVERGAARRLPTGEGETAQYVPVPPTEVMEGLRARQTRMLDDLTRELTALLVPTPDAAAAVWLRGCAPILGRLNALLQTARQSVAIALPQRWESALRPGLEAVKARAVRLDRVLIAPGQETSTLVALMVDGREALLGSLGEPMEETESVAFVTEAPFLVRLAADYVRLRRAVALLPEAVARLERHDAWLDWEEAKQRRLLQAQSAATMKN